MRDGTHKHLRGEMGCLPQPCPTPQMGTTPLLTASKHGHEAVVEKLLAARTNKENKSLVRGG